MQKKRTGLVGWHGAVQKALGALLICRASLKPWTVHSLSKAECPVAQGPGHTPPSQRTLTGFWPHLATEEPLLVPLSFSTGCHCSECGSF